MTRLLEGFSKVGCLHHIALASSGDLIKSYARAGGDDIAHLIGARSSPPLKLPRTIADLVESKDIPSAPLQEEFDPLSLCKVVNWDNIPIKQTWHR